MRMFRRTVLGASLLAVALVAAACGGAGGDGGGDGEKPTLTIGADNFAESEIVAEMYAQVLENAGYTIERETGLTRETRIPSMETGEIDIAPEYLATLLLFLDPEAEATSDEQAVLQELEPLLADIGLAVLEPSAAVDTNAFVVTGDTASELDLTTVSDLAPVAGDLTLGGPAECPRRPFCILGLEEVYGVEFGEFVPLDAAGPLTIEALDNGDIDVALMFSTQGIIAENGWVLLDDDKGLQAADNITPLWNSDKAGEEFKSEIQELLNGVSATLTTEGMTELNGRVDVEGEAPADVAADFLTEQGLL